MADADLSQRDEIAAIYSELSGSEAPAVELPDAGSDAGAAGPNDAPADDSEPAPVPDEPPEGGPARDEQGRFAKKPDEKPETKAAVKPTVRKREPPSSADKAGSPASPGGIPPAAGAAPSQTQAGQAPQAPGDGAAAVPTPPKGPRAPGGWKVAVREKWDALPPEVKDEVMRREEEHLALATESKAARQQWQAVQQRFAPFEPHLRQLGIHPIDAAERLLQVDQHMRYAPTPQRAAALVQLAASYGLTPEDVGRAWASPPPGQNGHGGGPQDFRDPRVDWLIQKQEADARQAQQERAAEINKQLAAFRDTHEFYEDVRETMGALIESGAAQTLEEAYDAAIYLPRHKDIRAAVEQRAAAAKAKAKAPEVARAKAAAGSLRTSPVGGEPKGRDLSQRDEIASIYAELSSR